MFSSRVTKGHRNTWEVRGQGVLFEKGGLLSSTSSIRKRYQAHGSDIIGNNYYRAGSLVTLAHWKHLFDSLILAQLNPAKMISYKPRKR